MADQFLMPAYRLPSVDPQGAMPYQQVDTPLAAFGATGPVLQRGAQQIEQAGNVLHEIGTKEMGEANVARTNDALSSFMLAKNNLLFDANDSFLRQKGGDALKAAGDTRQKLADLKAQTMSGLSPVQQKLLESRLTTQFDHANLLVSSHVLQETETAQKQSVLGAIDASRNDASHSYNDPAIVEQNTLRAEGAAIAYAAKQGLGPQETANRQIAARSAVVKDAIDAAYGRGDFATALDIWKRYDGKLDADTNNGLAARMKEAQSQLAGARVYLGLQGIAGGNAPYNLKVAGFEGGAKGNAAVNPDSGAGGRYQFTDQTWLAMARKYLPETEGQTDAQVLQMRSDPAKVVDQDKVFAGFTRENEGALQKAGLPVNDTTRYLAHWFGPQGAVKLANADPNAPIENFLPSGRTPAGRTWAEANGIAGKTVAQVLQIAATRMGGGGKVPGQAPDLAGMTKAALDLAGPSEIDRAKAVERAMTIWKGQNEIADKAQRDAEHSLKLQGEEAEKTLTDLGNAVKPEDVGRYRSVLPAAQYSAWMLKARGEDAVDVPQVANAFRMRVDREDIAQELYTARANRQLGQATFDSLLTANRSYMKEDKPGTPYKSGAEFVRNMLDPGILTDPTAIAIGRVTQAKAKAEFDDWTLAHPGADRKTTMETADAIARRYATVQTQDLSIALPVPRFYPDQAKSQLSIDAPEQVQEKLRQSAKGIRSALDLGQMNDDEAAREFKVIEQWKSLQQLRINQAKPGAK